ncbi:HEAT repeat protein [Anatilimnocola aggregata]|uniref:HEAT repeat protein n=1 Tax=Anatilimnocola aggregata TaxID=2528021 RepID=A0A517YE38_9BACT|nr:HEAT repeat domain-containing protein [Anatilimnocola aggregata]QDU28495.1 HEAT repeat protein [Anatilimnocola aggregata]
MRVSSLRIAAVCGCCLAGCGTNVPAPVITPGPGTTVVESKTETSEMPEVQPTPQAQVTPTIKPRVTSLPPADPNDPVRQIAAKLVEPTGPGGWRISEAAALELERLGPDATARLLPLLGDKQLEVRRGAAFHLLSSFDPAIPLHVAAFTGLLADEDATIRGIGLQAVRQMNAADMSTAQPQLTAMLDPERETKVENRVAIVRLAGNLGTKGTAFTASLTKSATTDPDERVRSAAIFALTQVATPEQSLPTLRQALTDKQAAVRLVAAGRLRSLSTNAEPAAADLGNALADEDERVRTAASEALVRIGPTAQPALTKALESNNVNAKKLALACLSSLGPAAKPALPAIEKCQQDSDKDISEAAKVLAARLKG